MQRRLVGDTFCSLSLRAANHSPFVYRLYIYTLGLYTTSRRTSPAELTFVVGYIAKWSTCPQTVTHPGTNHFILLPTGSRIHELLIQRPNRYKATFRSFSQPLWELSALRKYSYEFFIVTIILYSSCISRELQRVWVKTREF